MSASDSLVTETPDVLLAALERADDGIVIVDSAHRVTHFNAGAERIWKLARADVVGRDAEILTLNCLQADPVADFRDEISLVRHDGSRIRAAISLSSIAHDGAPHRVVFARDVTADAERRVRIGLLHAVSDQTNRAVIITDTEQNIVYVNSAFTTLFGYTSGEAEGRHAGELIAGCHTDRKAVAKLVKHLMRGGRRGEAEVLAYDKDGEEIWVCARIDAFRDKKGRVKHIFALLEDITETKQLRSLQQLIMSSLADEVPITDIADRLCRRVEEIAPDVVCSLLHVDAAGLIHPLGGPSLPEDYSRALDGIAIGPNVGSCGTAAFYGEPVLATDLETDARWQPYKAMPLAVGLRACWSTPVKAKDGRVIATFAFYYSERRAPSNWHRRIVEACVDLGAFAIERKEARAEIARLAYHDILTGLPNRAQLRHLITTAIDACPTGSHVALAFLDVDHFKDVNDTLGHAAGDELLIQLAQRLREQIGPEDMLGRIRHLAAAAQCRERRARRGRHHGGAGCPLEARIEADANVGQHRHQPLSRSCHRHRYADAAGRRRHVHGQAGRTLDPSHLQRRDERADRAAFGADRRITPRHRGRGTEPQLPAADPQLRRRDPRRRGAGALA
jgi:PAS domain S-box-containing protein